MARMFQVHAPGWGFVGWFYGTDGEANALARGRDVTPCEFTGGACVPFPGVGDDFPPRARWWELWDGAIGMFAGWLHADQKGALLVDQNWSGLTLTPAPAAAAAAAEVPPPPVGVPDPDGAGSERWKLWAAAGGVAAALALAVFVATR